MADPKPRVKLPASAAAGEPFAIRTIITHEMESGLRKDADGNAIPRKIINRFTCEFNGQTVIDMVLEPGVSANPFVEFDAMIDAAGTFTFTWYDDDGSTYTTSNDIALA